MRLEQPNAFQLLHGSGAPRAGSGLDPYNGVNDPWRWSDFFQGWISNPVDVSWEAGATIPSFAAPAAGGLVLYLGTSGTSPGDLDLAKAVPPPGATTLWSQQPGDPPFTDSVPSDPATVATAGTGTAFLFWGLVQAVDDPDTNYTGTRADVLPAELRSVEDILGADFTIVDGPYDWPEEAVGNLGDFYIDITSPSVDLWGPRDLYTWGAAPASQLRGSVVEVFTADGTWSKPAGATSVQVSLISAGGGGVAGSRMPADDPNGNGGSGGLAGTWSELTFPATSLPSTVTVTVGAGGTGQPGLTTDDTPAAMAADHVGEPTSFGDFLLAPVGDAAGTIASGENAPGPQPGGLGGSQSATSNSTAGSAGAIPSVIPGATGGAGGAAGADGGNGTGVSGGLIAPGGSGGGGGFHATTPGDGGNGGGYGAGGGGGGASVNGAVSGSGGDGSPGIAVITTYF